jgi:cell division protein ZapA
MTAAQHVVSVEILGQSYPIRSALEQTYVLELAAHVDERMRAAADAAPSGDLVRLAILAALNIADELYRCRESRDSHQGRLLEHAERIERLVDAALAT